MIRLMGAVLIILGSIGISYSLICDMRKAVELKKDMIKLLQLLESEIRHRKLNLSECFMAIADRMSGPVSVFLSELAEELQYKTGTPLSELWQDKVKQHFEQPNDRFAAVLKENEIVQLCRFGAELGFSDQTMQLNIIRQYEQQLGEEVDRAVKKIRDTSRIYGAMGVMGGAFIVIMLL